jgi:hypothetical protein
VLLSSGALDQFRKHEWGEEFMHPVLELHPSITEDYLKVIATPMDLGTVEQRLVSGAYASPSALVADVNLVFDNAIVYNSGEDDVSLTHARLLECVGAMNPIFHGHGRFYLFWCLLSWPSCHWRSV